jgi:hypothetical protein
MQLQARAEFVRNGQKSYLLVKNAEEIESRIFSINYQGSGRGTDPGIASAATQAEMANMAARPF